MITSIGIHIPHANIRWLEGRSGWMNNEVANGVLTHTHTNFNGESIKFAAGIGFFLSYSSGITIMDMKVLQSPQKGVLYDEKDKPISTDDAELSIEYSNLSFTASIKCKAGGVVYGYMKVTLKMQDGSLVTQVLKIRFK